MGDEKPFSHLGTDGSASMVDVSGKPVTRRVARASCRVLLRPDVISRLSSLPKGDAVAIARIAGVQVAKRTDEWIPLAHPLPVDRIAVEVEAGEDFVHIRSSVVCTARTGAEMEALVACSAAALALYDMVKAVQKDAVITDLRLESKSGGSGGDYRRGDD